MALARYFSTDRAAAIAGVPEARLRRWSRLGLVRPELVGFYEFKDLLEARVVDLLATEHGIPIRGKRGLRATGEWLRAHRNSDWSALRLHVAGREVVFEDGARRVSATGRGQLVEPGLAIDLRRVEVEVRRAARRVSERPRQQQGKVDRVRGVKGSSAVIAGTRIEARTVFEMHRAGASDADIMRAFPKLTRADVEAAIKHCAHAA